MPRPTTPHQRGPNTQAVLDLHGRRLPQKAIAARLGISRHRVYQILARHRKEARACPRPSP